MGGSAIYTEFELYQLWRRFQHDPEAVEILQGFALCDKETAADMIARFEIKEAARGLNMANRGKGL